MEKLDRLTWYNLVADRITSNLEGFYETFYAGSKLVSIGSDYRLEPCPMCGHANCSTVSSTKNSVHCFSGACGWKGTHINAYIAYAKEKLGKRQDAIIGDLERWSGYLYPRGTTPEEIAAEEARIRVQEMREKAVRFYCDQLFSSQEMFAVSSSTGSIKRYTPLEYQTRVRRHTEESLRLFRVMFSCNYMDLRDELIMQGYKAEEIKAEAKIWFPQNTFVYPYFHPSTGDILRFNIKNPFEATMTDKQGEEYTVQGYSTGAKVMGYAPGFSFKKDIVLVEGENDAISVFEHGEKNVVWVGGRIREQGENQLAPLEKAEGIIFTAYDNDKAGEAYYELTQSSFPHKDVRPLTFPGSYNDIDDYCRYAESLPSIKDMESAAAPVPTTQFRIFHEGAKKWSIVNRHRALFFEITDRNRNDELVGKVDYYVTDVDGVSRIDERQTNQTLLKCKAKTKPFNLHLAEAIDEFYNNDLEKRTFQELIEIYPFTSYRQKVLRFLAGYLHRSRGEETNNLVSAMKRALPTDVVDTVLKEMNDLQNEEVMGSLEYIPKVRIAQYFNIRNRDAYMYFTREMRDGDVCRRIPYLLRNDKVEIRLDLLKRKDPQCLLLIDNKYELRDEVAVPIMDSHECSLWQSSVDAWINNEIPDEKLNPGNIIREIEEWCRRLYFFKDKLVYKILALYIYGTYFYEIFGEFPYLFLNGEKGSGKSTLDSALYLLCFDAKHAINITDASLFRMISIEGGTMILDEMENLTSRSKAADSVMAAVLKGGYARAGSVYRFNPEENTNDSFDPYGPKIISNIFGLEDIIGDRCINIRTYRLKPDDGVVLEDPKVYVNEKMDIIRDVTSRCCISALKYFELLHSVFNSKANKIKTHSPRASQLINPLLAVARFVDLFITEKAGTTTPFDQINGPYESALTLFHDTVILQEREAIEDATPEGIMKFVVTQVAYELMGRIELKDRQYTITEKHKYTDPIRANIDEGWFEINTLHLKCFLEEHMPGDRIYTRNLTKWVELAFNVTKPSRHQVRIDNEDMIRENNGNKQIRVNFYRFYFRDLINEDVVSDILPVEKPGVQATLNDLF